MQWGSMNSESTAVAVSLSHVLCENVIPHTVITLFFYWKCQFSAAMMMHYVVYIGLFKESV